MKPSESQSVEILLAEDNPGDVELARNAFQAGSLSHRLHVVENGVEAIAFLRKSGTYKNSPRPDLILLDLNLPKMDGHEVLAEIKTDSELRRIPIVVLTSSLSEIDLCEAYDLHANCYIAKPLDYNRFAEIIRAIELFWFNIVRLPSNHR